MTRNITAFLLLTFSSAAFADVKSTNRVTMGENVFTSTVLMKQGKVRNEMTLAPGVSTVSIQDCSGHRLIQLNDRARTYLITEIGSESDQTANTRTGTGTVTLSVNDQDTGESKQLFGYTARHFQGTITSEAGSGSCGGNLHMKTDGWYIDLPEIEGCAPPEREMLRSRMQRDGCNDRLVLNTSGVEKLGYPVLLDMTIKDNGRNTTFHQETTGLSAVTLDPALFEIPAGYKQVQSYQQLMGLSAAESPSTARPSEGSSENANGFGLGSAPAQSANEKTQETEQNKGVLRIGVTQVTSGVDQSLATDGWQQQLINDINFLGGQGVVISIDPQDREAALDEAKQKSCDYVVFTNVSTFKTASVGEKLGRVFGAGGLGGVGGTGHGRVDIGAEVKVFQPDNPVPILDGNNDFRQNDADATAKGLLQTEARYVMLEIKKLKVAK